MKIFGFNFKKIHIEKISDSLENLKINTNVDILEIIKVDSGLFKGKDELLGVKFKYSVDYDPRIAKIELLGSIIVGIDSKSAKEVLKKWEEKKVQEDFRMPLFNVILRKSSLKAIQLEDEMNLPIHIPFPSLRKQSNEDTQKD